MHLASKEADAKILSLATNFEPPVFGSATRHTTLPRHGPQSFVSESGGGGQSFPARSRIILSAMKAAISDLLK
jgi:hypothetical protein